jgi:hypothetical protein
MLQPGVQFRPVRRLQCLYLRQGCGDGLPIRILNASVQPDKRRFDVSLGHFYGLELN